MLHFFAGGSFHLQTQIRGITVGAANPELLHFEATVRLHYFVEDPLHHVGVDQMAFGFNYFLERHELPVYLARPFWL